MQKILSVVAVIVCVMCLSMVVSSATLLESEHAGLQGEAGVDHLLPRTLNLEVVPMTYEMLRGYFSDSLLLDAMLSVSLIRMGVPYLWGGGDWRVGVDCSHFTMKLFNDIGLYYENYMTTRILKDVEDSNGLVAVPVEEMKKGDLLVYGYYDSDSLWHGHVVVLIDPLYRQGDGAGLVVGSQSNGGGVSFVAPVGFPDYYRVFWIRLQKVLRVKGLYR